MLAILKIAISKTVCFAITGSKFLKTHAPTMVSSHVCCKNSCLITTTDCLVSNPNEAATIVDGTMAALITKRPTKFAGLGKSVLVQQIRGRVRQFEIPSRRLHARKLLREKCPLVPGVYGWLDSNQQLIYVGKSKSLRMRLLGYFAKTPSDKKMTRIRQHSQHIVWEPVSHELLALIREQELIYRWRPEFNSIGQPVRMRPAFVCVSGSPAPNARLAYRIPNNVLHTFGPITGTNRLREAIVTLNQVFQLRDCPDKTKFDFDNQQFLFENRTSAKCIRHELGTCPAPCAAMCSKKSYAGLVDKAIDFLNGDCQPMLRKIRSTMTTAASREAFETAAIYRDYLDNLSWLDRRLKSLRMAEKNLTGVLSMPARRNRTAWLVLRNGKICATTVQPNTPRQAELIRKQLSSLDKSPTHVAEERLDISLQLIIISWARKFPELEKQVFDLHSAIEYCDRILAQQWQAA